MSSHMQRQKKDRALPAIVNVGFGNIVFVSKIVAIVSPASSPIKRLRDEAKESGRLVDATEGRRTRAIIVTESGHIVLSALQVETLTQRIYEAKAPEHEEG